MSLTEWLVLCLVSEQPTHGFAVARLLGPDGSMGQVWRVPKPVVYRALQLLPIAAALGERLAEATGFERTLALWRYETVHATLRFLDAAMPARAG